MNMISISDMCVVVGRNENRCGVWRRPHVGTQALLGGQRADSLDLTSGMIMLTMPVNCHHFQC